MVPDLVVAKEFEFDDLEYKTLGEFCKPQSVLDEKLDSTFTLS
jgi:hypothetical protein